MPDRTKTDLPAQQETAKKPQKVRKESQEMKSPSLQPKVAGEHQKQTEAEPTNKERFFGSDARIAATLKQISLCCNDMKCEECPIQEICCQPPIEFLKWLDKCNG